MDPKSNTRPDGTSYGPIATIGLCESVPERGGLLIAPTWSGQIRWPLRP